MHYFTWKLKLTSDISPIIVGLGVLESWVFFVSISSLNSICTCGKDIKTSAYFLLNCPNYSHERSNTLNIIGTIDRSTLTRNDFQVTEILLYSDSNSNNVTSAPSSIPRWFLYCYREIWCAFLLDWIWFNCIIKI